MSLTKGTSMGKQGAMNMNPAMSSFVLACLVLASVAAGCGAGEEGQTGRPFAPDPFEATLDSLASHQLPSWFEDAKFGIFIHWGPYSVPAYADLMFADLGIPGPSYAEWYWFMLMRIRWPSTILYHLRHFGTDIVYEDFIELWHAEAFDAESLVKLIRSSGARYAVLVTKHHDGVALFESATTERTTAAMGPRRNFVAEWTRAMRSAGLKVGFYYSLYEWFHPLYPAEAAYWGLLPKMDPINPFTGEPVPYRGLLPATRDYVADHMLPQLLELLDGYRPDLLWFDGGWDRPESYWRTNEVIAHFYNQAFWEGREVAVNDRGGYGAHGDFATPEYKVFGETRDMHWETCRGIGFSFGYNQFETDRHYLTSDELVDMLVDVVSKKRQSTPQQRVKGDRSLFQLPGVRIVLRWEEYFTSCLVANSSAYDSVEKENPSLF